MKLDVGCGTMPTGDVNCDLHKLDVGHRGADKIIHARQISNFVLCDAQHLPFQSDVFETVYSSHAIEHVEHPYQMLKEMLRVSCGVVVVVCPHRLGDRICKKHNPFHVGYFNKKWFVQAATKLCANAWISYSEMAGLPFDLFGVFRVPLELHVELRKIHEVTKQ